MKKIETALGWDNNQDRINQLKEMRAAEVSKLNARGFEDMDDAFSNEDQAELMEENAERAAEGEVLSENLEKIDMAIAWAEAGQDGICIKCGQPIEEDRHRANPTAITCKADRDYSADLTLNQVHEKIDELA
ncbi:MAG TPA: TraR/DksA C4-type zinc finger protein [Candidatus Paceibacterota bacterium]|jgi:RNA polymerase-binding transcription factor DksA|nr:TraR/DksA C4-type zinc finger protein [Candidatus Paceibacterota bacterium]HOH11171.1 TraR/DksA C4-type zinc finger protein [Candidatus Paceibacterota bacterium]HOY11206.1 TraR/DksA C4-type zinc finger protein [Candidatus Paceibacterota bacterium]HPI24580.1 TraR/DksA C4-type zinc finger protein [Candidatus Paceibacterota bacterium]HPN89405.1 TraR/DksA C4-type zinc finger protein [Candidatus Paceibacterota bacterium]